jgi:hypothetical protein
MKNKGFSIMNFMPYFGRVFCFVLRLREKGAWEEEWRGRIEKRVNPNFISSCMMPERRDE